MHLHHGLRRVKEDFLNAVQVFVCVVLGDRHWVNNKQLSESLHTLVLKLLNHCPLHLTRDFLFLSRFHIHMCCTQSRPSVMLNYPKRELPLPLFWPLGVIGKTLGCTLIGHSSTKANPLSAQQSTTFPEVVKFIKISECSITGQILEIVFD